MSFDPEQARAIIAARGQKAVDAPADLPPTPPIAAPEAGGDEAKKEPPMAEEQPDLAAIQAKATEDAIASANARLNAVLASEHYKGREPLATTLMKSPTMSADDIIAALAVSPAPVAAAAAQDEADGKAMIEEMKAGNAPALGVDAGQGGPAAKQNSWAAIYDEMNRAA